MILKEVGEWMEREHQEHQPGRTFSSFNKVSRKFYISVDLGKKAILFYMIEQMKL